MEDRPDLCRLQPLRGEVASGRVAARVDRLHYGADPLHDIAVLVRRILELGTPGTTAAVDHTIEQVRFGARVGFDGHAIPEPSGPLTGLDSGGNWGSGYPSATPRDERCR